MLLKSIELKNFRLYKTHQRVDFSCDSKKNVTVIMGENATGKTTLAQAFSWCLYGEVAFNDPEPISFSAKETMPTNSEEEVFVAICLLYGGREYEIKRSKVYRKDGHGQIHSFDAVLEVSYVSDEGQTEYLETELEKEETIQEIIPKSLSGYFFFDGERIDRMGKDIQYGEGTQFADAVRNLLGLSALSSAIDHLKCGGGRASVVSTYRKRIKELGDPDQARLLKEIEGYESQIEILRAQYDQKNRYKSEAEAYTAERKRKLDDAASTKRLLAERDSAEREQNRARDTETAEQAQLFEQFGGKRQGKDYLVGEAWSYLLAPLLKRAEESLENHPVKDASLPGGITTDTITALLESGTCICGATLAPGSEAVYHLMHLIDLVPPRYIGGAVKQYRSMAKERIRDTNRLLPKETHAHIDAILDAQERADQQQDIIDEISDRLLGMEDVSKLERDYQEGKAKVKSLEGDLRDLYARIDHLERELDKKKEEQESLDSDSLRVSELRKHLAYADYIYQLLSERYAESEQSVKRKLEKEINAIFAELFDGSLSLRLDDDYNVTVTNTLVDGSFDGVETSEAQSIAVIFAFISGVLRLARDTVANDIGSFEPENYPLVMDAPLSNFDKRRIKSVCRVMPKIAEQVIIMIKDTDGELALGYMTDSIGARYEIEHNPAKFESTLTRV